MTIDWELLFFIVFAGYTIGSALLVVFAKEIVRNVTWLAFTFIGVAIIFIFLGAEYIAIIQILVYVGAVSVLILFGVMLTKRRLTGGGQCER
ncbi:MAG: NADH-quinone oxidoreductase subunit J [Methanomassiliicoccales archaeon]|jgi:NADH:ubiquinone oxidoreductase subunit 6 (subunit J)|nr:NADH-quinone oxidoreductase subunit J [Methanomassiliicoccales archaeon]MDD1755829.1 NADH-quinone oxidoreductase subunit J [Methanomassiliicoccales archaeon]